MPSVRIDSRSTEKDKTHQIFLIAHPSSLYDMRPRPSSWEERQRLNLGRIISLHDLKGTGDIPRTRSKLVVHVQDGSSIGAFMPAEDRALEDIALLMQAQHSSMSLCLLYVWTDRYEGRAGKGDVTAGTRVLRNDVKQSSARMRGGYPRADMAVRMATLRLRRMRTSGTKGSVSGAKTTRTTGRTVPRPREKQCMGGVGESMRRHDASITTRSGGPRGRKGVRRRGRGQRNPAGGQGRQCSATTGEAVRGHGAGNPSCVNDAAHSNSLPPVVSHARGPRARKATRRGDEGEDARTQEANGPLE
jgi:hypothetical protein